MRSNAGRDAEKPIIGRAGKRRSLSQWLAVLDANDAMARQRR
jgi:hypothetical protein